MSLTMSTAVREESLNSMLEDGEHYEGKVWITIMANAGKLLGYSLLLGGAGGALSNTYGYMGLTEKHLNLVTVGTIDASKITGKFAIPLTDIKKIKIKKTLIGGGQILYFETADMKMKIAINGNALLSDIKDQKENREKVLGGLKRRFEQFLV